VGRERDRPSRRVEVGRIEAPGGLGFVVAVVVAVMMMGKGLGRYGRDGEDGDSGKGKHQIAKFHKNQFLSTPGSFGCKGPALPADYFDDARCWMKFFLE